MEKAHGWEYSHPDGFNEQSGRQSATPQKPIPGCSVLDFLAPAKARTARVRAQGACEACSKHKRKVTPHSYPCCRSLPEANSIPKCLHVLSEDQPSTRKLQGGSTIDESPVRDIGSHRKDLQRRAGSSSKVKSANIEEANIWTDQDKTGLLMGSLPCEHDGCGQVSWSVTEHT